jgi:hypothetical protein
MTLGNMRANGVRSLDVSCWQCHHEAVPPMPDGWRWTDDGRWACQLRQDAQHSGGAVSGASAGLLAAASGACADKSAPDRLADIQTPSRQTKATFGPARTCTPLARTGDAVDAGVWDVRMFRVLPAGAKAGSTQNYNRTCEGAHGRKL